MSNKDVSTVIKTSSSAHHSLFLFLKPSEMVNADRGERKVYLLMKSFAATAIRKTGSLYAYQWWLEQFKKKKPEKIQNFNKQDYSEFKSRFN